MLGDHPKKVSFGKSNCKNPTSPKELGIGKESHIYDEKKRYQIEPGEVGSLYQET